MSLRLTFDAFVRGRSFLGLKSLKLDGLVFDRSMTRDRLSYGLFRSRLPAPRSVHARLFVNGQYRGERWDAVSVRRNFGGRVGNLYRGDFFAVDPYLWRGPDVNLYVPVPLEPKTHETTADHTRIVAFVDVLNNRPASFGTVCNLPALLDYLALEAVIGGFDGLVGPLGPHNWYHYYRDDTGLSCILPWDPEGTWGFGGNSPARGIFEDFHRSKITSIVENDPALRNGYKLRILELSASEAHPARVLPRIDFIYNQIREAVYADPNKDFTNAQFDAEIVFMKAWAEKRRQSLQQQLSGP